MSENSPPVHVPASGANLNVDGGSPRSAYVPRVLLAALVALSYPPLASAKRATSTLEPSALSESAAYPDAPETYDDERVLHGPLRK